MNSLRKTGPRLAPAADSLLFTQTHSVDMRTAAEVIVNRLLDPEPPARLLMQEASVHRSRNARTYVACFTSPEGGQTWRSTGLQDYQQALLLARGWEKQARSMRDRLPRRRRDKLRPAAGTKPLLTQREVANLLGMSERGVREVERRAFAKLRKHPALRELWQQYIRAEESNGQLSHEEIIALFDLATDRQELQLVEKLVRLST